MSTSIVEYSEISMVLSDLAARYKGVIYDVSTQEGMMAAKAGKKEIATYRIALEKTRVKLKEESLKRGRLIDGEARPIEAELAALEIPIDNQIKAKERAEQAAREAAIQAEQDRILAEQAAAKAAEEKKMAEALAEIARQQAEIAKTAAESRAKIEAEERASRMRMEEEARQERLARQAREEVERVRRHEEEMRLKAERDKLEAERRFVEDAKRKEQAEAEAKAKALRDAEEAKRREEQRLATELLDGRQMLATFVQRYGQRAEFESIADLIEAFLEAQ